MSASVSSATISVASSLPVSSFAVNDVGKAVTSNGGEPSLPHQTPTDKLSMSVSTTTVHQSNAMESVTTFAKVTSSLPVSVPKQIKPSGTIITIAAPTRPSVIQPVRATHGKHHLPVRPLPITSLSQITSRPIASSTSTAATALIDPGGGFVAKTIAVQPSFLSTSLSVKPSKVAQHIFMAPGLNTPTSSLKLHQTFSPTFSYQLPSQPQVSASASNSRSSVSGSNNQPSLLVRSITSSQSTRTFVPLAMTSSQDSTRLAARTTNVLYQPTSTISISIPAKSNNQQDPSTTGPSNRIAIASSQAVGKPMYQVGITQRAVSSSSATPSVSSSKPPRFIAASPAAPAPSNRGVITGSAASGTPLTGTAFTYSATPLRHPAVTTITTSAIPIAKIYPPHAKYPALQPSVSGISAHARTTEFLQPITAARPVLSVAVTTTQSSISIATVVTSSAAPKSSSQLSSIMYRPASMNNSSTMYTPPSHGATSIRAPLNSAKNSASLTDTQIRINQSGLFGLDSSNRVVSTANVAPFTQGQLLHTTSPSLTGKEQAQLLQPLLPTSVVSQHLPNSSPKPAILRRPPRADNNITKKLTFETRVGQAPPLKTDHRAHVGNILDSSVASANAKRFSAHDMIYPINIKPELGSQASFNKPLVASNGLSTLPKLQNNVLKDFHSSPFLPTSSLVDDLNISQIVKRIPQSDTKVKNEPGYHPNLFKNKQAAGHLTQQAFQSSYLPINKHLDVSPRILPNPVHHINHHSSNKHQQVQQGSGMLVSSAVSHRATHPASLNATSRLPPNLTSHKDFKPEMNNFIPVSGMKREYDKISTSDGPASMDQIKTLPVQDPQIGLSPRKKPRKQTHVVAEELPDADQPPEEDMSTDDADECEDEVPLISPPFTDSGISSASQTTNTTSDARKLAAPNRLSPVVSSSSGMKTAPPSSPIEVDPPSEYVDEDGVRYVAVRERPPILLLNGHRIRSVTNHFTHYADVKVKEKKTSLHDVSFNRRRLKGWKILQFASEIEQLSSLDEDILERVEAIKNGLLQHSSSLLSNGKPLCEPGCVSPAQMINHRSPGTPRPVSSTPTQSRRLSSFGKSFSSCSGGNPHKDSPQTPIEKKTSRFHEEIMKIEDMAQANIQRCHVMQEQLSEVKSIMVKVLDQRETVANLVKVGREVQKSTKSSSNGSRNSKKKKS